MNIAEDFILKIMNKIFSNHIYPTIWTKNFLKPIYKKLDVKLTGNYRGLAIGSAMDSYIYIYIYVDRSPWLSLRQPF